MTTEGADLGEFVAASYAKAYRTACLIVWNRADAEEAVQEAFLRAWRFRATLREGQPLEPWLYRVLVNSCYSKLRATARHRKWDAELVDDVETCDDDPSELVDAAEIGEAVRAALEMLPEALRVTVVLRYFAGLSEKEIALAIRRRPGTVKSRLYEGRRLLAADPRLAMLAEVAL